MDKKVVTLSGDPVRIADAKRETGLIEALRAKQMIAASMVMEGKSTRTILDRLNIEATTLNSWMRETEFQQMIRTASREIYDESLVKMNTLATLAVDAIKLALTCGKPETQLRAAMSYFEIMMKPQAGQGEVEEARHVLTWMRDIVDDLDPEVAAKIRKELAKRRNQAK